MKQSKKAFKFTIGLLYPAVLGSIIFNLFNGSSVQGLTNEPLKYVLVGLIVILYIMDYLYTNTDEIRDDYSLPQGVCDFIIIAFLFISVNAAYGSKFQSFSPYVALLLAGTKLFALVWELVRKKKDSLAIWSFGIFLIIYIGIQIFAGSTKYPLFLLIVLGLDILMYFNFESIKSLFQRKKQIT